jgi:hypothetical protein
MFSSKQRHRTHSPTNLSMVVPSRARSYSFCPPTFMAENMGGTLRAGGPQGQEVEMERRLAHDWLGIMHRSVSLQPTT